MARRDTLDTVEKLRAATPGQWWDHLGGSWTLTEDGEWVDRFGCLCPEVEIPDTVDFDIDVDCLTELFVVSLGLSRVHPGRLARVTGLWADRKARLLHEDQMCTHFAEAMERARQVEAEGR